MVIPSGESTRLDQVFSDKELQVILESVKQGLSLFATGGAAYWLSKKRIWSDMCARQPTKRDPIEIKSRCPIFEGIAKGPLIPFPGQTYDHAYFRSAITIEQGQEKILIPIKAAGSFDLAQSQKIEELATYAKADLEKHRREYGWDPAVIGCQLGDGRAILSMIEFGYRPGDIDVKAHEKKFPGSNWKEVPRSISPLVQQQDFLVRVLQYFN